MAAAPVPMSDSTVKIFSRPHPSWIAVVTVMLLLLMPICAWLIALGSRVSVAEAELRHLATAEQVAMQTQKLEDFEEEYRRDRINDGVAAARYSK
jgi:hypothetical protein